MGWFLLVGAIITEVAPKLSLRASEGLRKRKWIAPLVA